MGVATTNLVERPVVGYLDGLPVGNEVFVARCTRITQLVLLMICFSSIQARADSLLIAVASNFSATAADLAEEFEAASGHEVQMSTASTGKLFAQIENGAPFDILLAADSERPALLGSSGLGVPGTRFTYAVGGLVLWSRDPGIARGNCRNQLNNLGSRRLAIANPDTAPYGSATRQALQQLALFDVVRERLVTAENITQTLQFVASGNASLGFVALSQLADERLPVASCTWSVPPGLHDPIEQQAILLTRAANDPAATGFMLFLRSEAGQRIVAQHGYSVAGKAR